ncbi:MAG: hypothetical protein IT361_18320 [Gemmatimonadaceae bacterium]|nr:hypothetical protein [Gemmatimonadaceae bacterium]
MTTASRARRPSTKRGVALITVLGVLLLLLVLSTGAVHIALGDARRGVENRGITIAGAAADAGAWSILRDWAGFDFDSMAVGDTIPTRQLAAGDGWAIVRGRRISPIAWWITALGVVPDSSSPGHAQRRVSLVYRQQLVDWVDRAAALSARESVTVAGTGRVIGTDTLTGSWSVGCADTGTVAGIAVPDTSTVRAGTVVGIPPLDPDPRAGLAGTYTGNAWASLLARATVTLAPGAVVAPAPTLRVGVCDTSDSTNWGEPRGAGACARHAPVVHATGDLELRGGRGQGVLLVEGDLTISGGAEFHGVIVTRDDLRSGRGGGRVYGAVLAGDARPGAGDGTEILDGVTLRWSRCAALGALRRWAPLVPVRRRAWAPLH